MNRTKWVSSASLAELQFLFSVRFMHLVAISTSKTETACRMQLKLAELSCVLPFILHSFATVTTTITTQPLPLFHAYTLFFLFFFLMNFVRNIVEHVCLCELF